MASRNKKIGIHQSHRATLYPSACACADIHKEMPPKC